MTARIEHRPAAARPADAGEARPAARTAEARFERLRAPFSLRCGALLIDYIVLVAILPSATLLARLFGDEGRAGSTLLTMAYGTVGVAALLNFVLLPALVGRTLGKWVTGLRIERRDGMRLSFGRALVRHVVGYLLTLATFGVGFLLAAFSTEGRALHDLLAGTIVVRSRDGARGFRMP